MGKSGALLASSLWDEAGTVMSEARRQATEPGSELGKREDVEAAALAEGRRLVLLMGSALVRRCC